MAIKQNHYDVLGVSPRATSNEIRSAYRRLVRQEHPDVARDANHASIAAINEAWNVLSDPAKRRSFDLTLKTPLSASSQSTSQSTSEVYDTIVYPPARFPWRSMLILAGIGVTAVLVLNAFATPETPGKPDQLLQPGSCVNIDSTRFAYEVTCAEPHDAEVVQFVAIDRPCPAATMSYLDRQGMGKACVRDARADASVQLP